MLSGTIFITVFNNIMLLAYFLFLCFKSISQNWSVSSTGLFIAQRLTYGKGMRLCFCFLQRADPELSGEKLQNQGQTQVRKNFPVVCMKTKSTQLCETVNSPTVKVLAFHFMQSDSGNYALKFRLRRDDS